MRSFFVLVALLVAGTFGVVLALGFLGLVNLQSLYMDVVGLTQGISFEDYQSSRLGVSLRYPRNWNIDERFLDSQIDVLARDLETSEQQSSFKINRTQPELTSEFGFDSYVDDLVSKLRDNRSRFRRLDRREVSVAGHQAVRITFTHRADGEDFQASYYWLLDGKDVYQIWYETDASNQYNHQFILEMMLESFELVNTI